eukprot:1277875-Amphidinium_carterae.1
MAEETFRQELERLRLQNEQLETAFIQLEQRQQQPQADVAAVLAGLPQALAGAVQAAVAARPARPVERKTLIDVKGRPRILGDRSNYSIRKQSSLHGPGAPKTL